MINRLLTRIVIFDSSKHSSLLETSKRQKLVDVVVGGTFVVGALVERAVLGGDVVGVDVVGEIVMKCDILKSAVLVYSVFER